LFGFLNCFQSINRYGNDFQVFLSRQHRSNEAVPRREIINDKNCGDGHLCHSGPAGASINARATEGSICSIFMLIHYFIYGLRRRCARAITNLFLSNVKWQTETANYLLAPIGSAGSDGQRNTSLIVSRIAL
jgi:hypothetical protein